MLAKTPAPLLAALAAVSTVLAQTTPPPVDPALRARFGFEGPFVVKVGDGLYDLKVADLDGDGRLEAIAIDGRRGRLVLARLKGRETSLEPIPTNGQISGYAVADVHGDGVPDLLVVDSRGRLTVRHPGKEATGAPIELGVQGRGLAMLTGDLDGDGKADLVVAGRSNLRWVTGLGGTPKLSPLEATEENTFSYHLTDVDGDQKLDLVAISPNSNMSLRLRRGRGDGTFGPWRILAIDELRAVFPAQLADGTQALGTIGGPTRRVALQQWQEDGAQAALEWWPFGENPTGKALPFVVGDLDQDGDDDLVLARPDRAQLLVHEWTGATFVVHTVPTLAGVAALSLGDVDRDGKVDLVLVSPEEDAVGWKSGALPLGAFPELLPCPEKPLAAAVDPNGGVLVLARNDKRESRLHRLAPNQDGVVLAELGRLPADPTRLLLADVGAQEGLEAVFVVPGEGLRTLTLGAEVGKAGKTKEKEAAGFTKKLDDGAVALCTADGKPALLAVRERFVRTFRIDGRGLVDVLAQDNGPEGLGELSLCADSGNGKRLYLDRKANKLVRTGGDGATETVEVPAFDYAHMVPFRGGALLLGAAGVLRVPFEPGFSLRTVTSHEPPTERTFYWQARSGDFDHDGIADLAVVDRQLPGLQILAGGKAGLQRALAMPIFETPPSEQPDSEPRELATGDLDGDGRIDLVLIAHDRILIYPQEP
jgi:hypothetical protein